MEKAQTITFLPTSDLEATDHFLQVVCGFRLACDQGVCRIYEISAGSFWGFCTHLEQIDQARQVILTYVCDKVDEWFEKLSKIGAQVDGPPRLNEKYRIYHFFCEMPDGYRLEVQRFEDTNWAIGPAGNQFQ